MPSGNRKCEGEYTKEEILEMYKSLSEKLGHPATLHEIDHSNEICSSSTLLSRFNGSIINIRKRLGYSHGLSKMQDEYSIENIEKVLMRLYRKYGRKLDYMELGMMNNIPTPKNIKSIYGVDSMNDVWEIVIQKVEEEEKKLRMSMSYEELCKRLNKYKKKELIQAFVEIYESMTDSADSRNELLDTIHQIIESLKVI